MWPQNTTVTTMDFYSAEACHKAEELMKDMAGGDTHTYCFSKARGVVDQKPPMCNGQPCFDE